MSGIDVVNEKHNVTEQVFLARQQVFDAERVVFGYELFYRHDAAEILDDAMMFDHPDEATRGVMERVLLQWGVSNVVGDRFGLINADASLVINGLHRAMPPEGIIFELREPTPFDEATVGALRQARIDGYHFALDNVSRLGDLENSELLPLASIVKIELTNAHQGEIERLITIARKRSPGVLVVAEKVETAQCLTRCIDHGFDLFQGYHLGQPEILQRPARPVSRRAIELLGHALADEAALADGDDSTGTLAVARSAESTPRDDVSRIVTAVASDPTLTFRALLAVNTDAFGLDRNVRSLEHAVALLGVDKLRCLAGLLAATRHTLDDDTDAIRGAARAITVAAVLDDNSLLDEATTVALLSVADQLYQHPLAALLDELPLVDELVQALRHGHGSIGRALDIVRACELGDRAALEHLAVEHIDQLLDLHQRSIEQARSTTSATTIGSGIPEPA